MKLRLLAGTLSLLAVASVGFAEPCDPGNDPDRSAIAAARGAVDATCHCDTPGQTHGQYVRCAVGVINGLPGGLRRECKRAVKRCYARSTCGKTGVVTCCRRSSRGKQSCSIEESCGACKPPRGGEACCGGLPSCCDACAPGDHPPCASTTTVTTTTTTSTEASATKVSTTTFTTRTLPCVFDCSGTQCPPGEAPVILRSRCGCAPTPACGSSAGVCGGNCPALTEGCHLDTFNNCCLCGGP